MRITATLLLAACILFTASACSPAATEAAAQASTPPASTAPAQPTASPSPAPATEPPATVSPAATATAQPADTAAKDYGQIGYDLMASESIGTVKLGMTESELLAALGQPDAEATAVVWGADGKKHSDWTYASEGLIVNMAEGDNDESEFVAYSIAAEAPCGMATQKGIKIGDSKDAVLQAYGYAVEDQSEEGTQESITAGSEYGGVVFGLKDGKVASIFIGASAE